MYVLHDHEMHNCSKKIYDDAGMKLRCNVATEIKQEKIMNSLVM